MIDTVVFENDYGDRLIPHQYGIVMKSHDTPLPAPRIYQYAIDGRDGMLDMTEWAGETKFENRDVTIAFLDMSAQFHQKLIQFAYGRMVKIMFSDDPEHYFYGRWTADNRSTRWRVTDGEMTFSCEPYRMCRRETAVRRLIHTDDPSAIATGIIALRAARKRVVPTITATGVCEVEYQSRTYNVVEGSHTFNDIVLTDQFNIMTITSGEAAGHGDVTVTVSWRDGVL